MSRKTLLFLAVLVLMSFFVVGCDGGLLEGDGDTLSENCEQAQENLETLEDTIANSPLGGGN